MTDDRPDHIGLTDDEGWPRTPRDALRPSGEVWTVEDLHHLPADGNRYEISRGHLLVTPSPSMPHNVAAFELARRLADQAPDQFRVVAPGIGLPLRHDVLYLPDLAVITAAAARRRATVLYPDEVLLVAEVLSPSNAKDDLVEKRWGYAQAGIPAYWIVDPEKLTVTILTNDGHGDYTETTHAEPGQPLTLDFPFPLHLDPADLA